MSSVGFLAVLIALFALLALAEARWAARLGQDISDRRLAFNFSIGLVNLTLGSILPISAVATAVVAERHGWGLLGLRAVPLPLAVLAMYLAHSLANYGLHRASHRFALLWRFHRLHHGDRALDLSTALRNHPVELVLGLFVASGTVLLLGVSPIAVAIADTILFAQNMCTHVNVRLPAELSRRLEWVFVTPGAHCVHHSDERALTDSNYGESVSWWDRLFGTWRGTQPVARIGLDTGAR
ncbi:sterol desaturase family protein [Sphingomonas sp. RT2P30]|uniref:sterol desaturase family protein n=1 Tax=Parasphingomonas halimpatiens TaxID=3096162 RepID=UPI002FCA2350